jgi:hypothetical protein
MADILQKRPAGNLVLLHTKKEARRPDMKYFFLILLLTFVPGNALAASASASLPISVSIINLATLPVEEAIAFCDDRYIACPAIRKKYEKEQEQQDYHHEKEAQIHEKERRAGYIEAVGQYSDTLRTSETGYYIE